MHGTAIFQTALNILWKKQKKSRISKMKPHFLWQLNKCTSLARIQLMLNAVIEESRNENHFDSMLQVVRTFHLQALELISYPYL